jgi:undecaprenyl-diphosphatase
MPVAQVIVLAIVQGLTEFLPVSSTAHLYLASWLLGWKPQPLEFDIALHVGTLLAILIYFFPEWSQIAQDVPSLFWLLAIGSIPVGIAGLMFNRQAEGSWRNPYVMGTMLAAVGAVMWIADRSGRGFRELASASFKDSVMIGLSQALAIVPGTSRSGVTISGGLLLDFSREAAARFSFLLSTPVVAAAAAKALYGIRKRDGLGRIGSPAFWAGAAVSAATGYAAITWFLYYLRSGGLGPFVYYRVIFGIIVLALAFIRRPAG